MNKKILLSFVIISFVLIIIFVLFNFILLPLRYKDYVKTYSKKYNVESALVFAIIKAESNFDRDAVSSSGAVGLMQIMPSTAKWIASELGDEYIYDNLFNQEVNIKYGCFYLQYLFSKFNNLGAVICAYNAGETIVRDWLDDDGNIIENKIIYDETKLYYEKVMDNYIFYKNRGV